MRLSANYGTLIATVLWGCSDAGIPATQYGATGQALEVDSDAPDSPEDESTGRCRLPPEPLLLPLKIGVQDANVELLITNTTEDTVSGVVEIYAMTSEGVREIPQRFQLAGLDEVALRVPLEAVGIDGSIDLAIISSHLAGSFADGRTTTTVGEFVYDIRETKPELLEDVADDAGLERVTVAVVHDGIDEQRLEAAMADTDDEVVASAEKLRTAVPSGGSSLSALTVSKTICFDANLILAGAGAGEDFWPTNTAAWARGQRIDATPAGGSFSTYWLDSVGCISGNFAVGPWSFKAYTATRLKKVGAVFTNINNKRYPDDVFLTNTFGATVSNVNQTIVYSASSSMHVSHLVTESLNNRMGELTSRSFPATINIRNNSPSPPIGVSYFDPGTEFVYIDASSHQNKWTVTHEMGHYIQYNEAEEFAWGYNATRPGVTCVSDPGHAAWSREFNSVAGVEGFASYWSSLLFNDVGQSDCWVRFSGAAISCAGPSTSYPVRVMETNCTTAGVPFNGDGNETDWQRAYWDITREDTLGTIPTVLELLTMMRNGSGWATANHFQQMTAAAALVSTPQYLESKWIQAASNNGIDW